MSKQTRHNNKIIRFFLFEWTKSHFTVKMTGSNLLHIRYSAGSVSITLRDLPLEITVSDLLARAEMKSSIPAQLTELLGLGMAKF